MFSFGFLRSGVPRVTPEDEVTALRNKIKTLETTVEAQREKVQEARMSLVESKEDVAFWRMRYEEQALELAALKSEFDSRKYSRDVQHMRMIGRKRQLDVSPFTKERADHDEASKRVMRVTASLNERHEYDKKRRRFNQLLDSLGMRGHGFHEIRQHLQTLLAQGGYDPDVGNILFSIGSSRDMLIREYLHSSSSAVPTGSPDLAVDLPINDDLRA